MIRFALVAALFYFLWKLILGSLFKGVGFSGTNQNRPDDDIRVKGESKSQSRFEKEGDYIDYEEVKE